MATPDMTPDADEGRDSSARQALPEEPSDVQRLAYSGHNNGHGAASYQFFVVDDAARARAWVGRIADRVTPAGYIEHSDTRLQIAFTSCGLRALGLPEEVLATFPLEFQDGMAKRAHVLGDDPRQCSSWEYGGNRVVHVALFVYAKSTEALAREVRALIREARAGGLQRRASQSTFSFPDKTQIREHFGFRDGLVQPTIGRKGADRAQPEDGTPGNDPGAVPNGEVVLGQRNGYGFRTIGPSAPRTLDKKGLLHDFITPNEKDLGANGTYVVLRKLEQDVAGFWNAIRARAEDLGKTPHWLAAKMVGRWMNGSSVVDYPDEEGPPPTRDTPGISFAADRHGYRCPFGAHIRRANPRDDLGDDPEASLAVVARHRLHRRGRVYGKPPADLFVDDGRRRGLIFITVGTSIRRQFEFVQNLWLTSTCFNGMHGEDDPVAGPRAPHYFGDGRGAHAAQTSPFSIPAYPLRRTVPALPRFVTMRGGDYFFMPGRRALRFLAALP
ncbi:MAG: peroxidase [Polyangiaceae bacterium]|nr:peroxidase [Polyangiaceae bacterium]